MEKVYEFVRRVVLKLPEGKVDGSEVVEIIVTELRDMGFEESDRGEFQQIMAKARGGA